jgi:hypothetical protein
MRSRFEFCSFMTVILTLGIASVAFAAGPGGGGGGAGGGGAAGGGSQPQLVNYKVTGTVIAPACDSIASDACIAFPNAEPFTLTYTVNLGTKPNLQNTPQSCVAGTAVDVGGQTIQTTRTVALYSKAITNFLLVFDNGTRFSAPTADISIENDTCLAGGVNAYDSYRIEAKTITGTNIFPSTPANLQPSLGFRLGLVDQAGFGLAPLPPNALASLDLATAAPEAHLLQYNGVSAVVTAKIPTIGIPEAISDLQLSTLEIVP